MTPRELAEKIRLHFQIPTTYDVRNGIPEWCYSGLESLLAEAMEEARENLHNTGHYGCGVCKTEIKQAKAAAYEDAAKIAEEYEDGNLGVFGANICVHIANQIRQQAKDLK